MSALLRPRKHARHAKPSKVAPVLAAGGLAAAFAVTEGAVAATSAHAGGSVAQFDRLAQCESGGRWGINTGNGYYGGLQFNLATWRSVGMTGYPHQASRETQIVAGQRLHESRGWKPWPACSRKLGLTGDGGVSGAPGAAPAAPPATRAPRADRRRTGTPPPFSGVLSTASVSRVDESVRAWQQQMKSRGWKIAVDGRFGPQSASVAQRFAAEKRLGGVPGTVDAAAYAAAWTAPVT